MGRTILLVIPAPTAQTPPAIPSSDASEDSMKDVLIKRRWLLFKNGTNITYIRSSRTEEEIIPIGVMFTLPPQPELR